MTFQDDLRSELVRAARRRNNKWWRRLRTMCSTKTDEEPLCKECAWHHTSDTPHNAESIVYQLNFVEGHGRPPSWDDAMAHCDDKMKKLWSVVLADEGYPDTSAMVEGFFAPTNKEQDMNPESAAHILPSERLQGEDAMISERKGDDNRVTLQSLTDKIIHKAFYRVGETGPDDEGTLTHCVLTMQNGFKITGQAAPAYPVKFDAELGQQLAFDDALRQAWRLEGYLLCERRFREEQGEASTPTDKINEAFPGSETIVSDETDDEAG